MEKTNEQGFYKYFELHTEYGPLYVYEKYKQDPKKVDEFHQEMPVTREFFTKEEGIRGYCTLDFINRTAVFTTTEMGMDGMPREHFMEELEPYDFLMKVAPFVETEEEKKEKAREIYRIFDCKANNKGNSRILRKEPEISQKTKNEVAKTLLKRYTV